jgi:hypothetical protein
VRGRKREDNIDTDKKRETGQVRTGHSRSLRITGNEGSNQGQFLPHIELSLFCLHCESTTQHNTTHTALTTHSKKNNTTHTAPQHTAHHELKH